MKQWCRTAGALLFGVLAAALVPAALSAQVTTASLTGTVRTAAAPIAGARVAALHTPSGTRYSATTRADGRYVIPGMRVGGPYQVTATMLGHESQSRSNLTLTLGVATEVSFTLREAAIAMEAITVTSTRADAVFSPERTGASTSVTREALQTMPNISGRLEQVARLTPQSSGGLSFAGQDPRLNNITVDGSYFRNSFGLGNTPGDRTGVAPISLDAIEQVQINIAPFDVRHGNFVGAGVNSVTRSGTNEFRGSLRFDRRDDALVGTKAGAADFDPGTFNFSRVGGWVSGPLVRNRLFFFLNLEDESLTEPGTTWRANTGTETVEGSITRVKATDLDALATYLRTNFDYESGPYQNYDHETPARRFLGKLDFNLNENNKLSLRYTHLDSRTDVLLSNSSSLGIGNRRTLSTGLNFQNSNYQILENIRSLVGEWNAVIGENMANNLIIGYSHHDESRASRGSFFPFVDIQEAGSVYTSFGFEPFTPNNELRYSSLQLQDNFTRFERDHTLTFGVSLERYESENVFFSGAQSVYVYNSLADFYTDANGYLANPNRTTSPVNLRRFQVRYSNIPGQEKPIQPLKVVYAGAYAQDVWTPTRDLRLTIGARLEAPYFSETGFKNPEANGMYFLDENLEIVNYQTDQMPRPKLLFSPRVGFNWDVNGQGATQLRGGTGIFTGSPLFVWISNQVGENGVITGFEQLDNTTARPFHPDPDHYKPTNVTGAPAASYALAFTDPNFRFPQVWRNNLAVDQRLPFGVIGTAEWLYSQDVNGVYYINANLRPANAQFTGMDNRPRWTGSNRIRSNVTSAVVLKNQDVGYAWNLAGSLERPFGRGFFAKAGYSYGVAKNTVDPGSVAFGSWNNNQHAADPNNPGLGYSINSPGKRWFGFVSYRKEYFRFGATRLSLFGESRTAGNISYTFAGDVNGDGGTSNDLIYVHRDVSEMNFRPFTTGSGATAKTFTAEEQAEAWDAYIEQDPYLRTRRGRYAERNAAFLPMVFRMDFGIQQELFTRVGGRRNQVSLRLDVLNFGNFLNEEWGVGERFVNAQPLIPATTAQGGLVSPTGGMQYTLRAVNGELLTKSLERTAAIADVYRIQLGLQYNFN
ncbi:MAG TPA: carboxypeptidase regulatory-like domain-containing protein [Longimicrobium sp.]|nr:carboxypeptidase regulatory-like domain-containing protein [Longimicrobium sp.]